MSGITITADSSTEFESGTAEYESVCRLDDNTFVVAYRDNSDFNFGKAVVGTRSGTAITVSEANAVTFQSEDVSYITVRALSSTKIVISYSTAANDNVIEVIVGTVSGTSITFGSAVSLGDVDGAPSVAVLDSSNFVVTVADGSDDDIDCFVCSVSGNTISAGSVQTLLSANPLDGGNMAAIGLDSTHFAFAWGEDAASDLYAAVGLVDTGAQTITFGAKAQIAVATIIDDSTVFMDKFDSTHFIVIGQEVAGPPHEVVVVACLYDTPTLAVTAGTQISTGVSVDKTYFSVCTMGTSNFLVSWYTTTGTQGEVRSGTLTGATDIAWDAQGAQVFDNSTCSYTSLCRMTDSYFLLGYKSG